MADTFRETVFGQLIYRFSGRSVLQYREERPDFVVPEHFKPGYKEKLEDQKQWQANESGSLVTTFGEDRFFDAHHDEISVLGAQTTGSLGSGSSQTLGQQQAQTAPNDPGDHGKMFRENRQPVEDQRIREHANYTEEKDPYVVDWYGEDDPEHPFNWSMPKKVWVTFCLCALTFTVYMGSSIVTPGLEDFATEHGIGLVPASLSISLFVFGYGAGPMLLSPLSEVRPEKLSRGCLFVCD